MKYHALSSYYYSNPEKYESLYHQRFSSESTIRFDFDVHGYRAFVVVIPEITQLITDILQINSRIVALTANLPRIALKQFQLKSLVDEIRLTNDIEGVYSTRKEIQALLDEDHKKGSKRFSGLVRNYLILTEQRRLSMSSCADIRAIYDTLVSYDVSLENNEDTPDGETFRKGPVHVCSRHGEVIHDGLSPESAITAAMTQALGLVNDDHINVFIRIAVFHYLIGYIHPFYNGNGRISRFISGYLLANELTPIIGYRLSYTVRKNLDQYLKSFRVANDTKNKGDLTSFVLSFLNIIWIAMSTLETSLASRKEQLEFYTALNTTLNADDRKRLLISNILIQNTLFGYSGIPIDIISSAAELSIPTVRKHLNVLLEKKQIAKVQDGHKILFDADLNVIASQAKG